MTFPRYPAYKDSGVAWLGEIPAHWDVSRIKNALVDAHNGVWGDEPSEGNSILCVRVADFNRQNFTVSLENPTYRGVAEKDREGRLLQRNDLLLEKSGGGENQPVGFVVIYEYDEPAVSSNFVARLTLKSSSHPRYVLYCFAKLYGERVNIRSIKQNTGIQNLDAGQYFDEPITFPPLPEQRTIAAFLDAETARIDTLVAKQTALIATLQEKRRALISHVVTKGLDPAAPMRDSGVPWLGAVPKHWDVRPLGNISANIQTGPFGSQLHAEDYVEDGVPVINPAHIQAGCIVPDPSCTISEAKADELLRHRMASGDIVFGRRGEMGRCAEVLPEQAGWLCGTGSLRVELNHELMLSRFAMLVLSNQGVKEQLELESVGSTMSNLNTTILFRLRLPLPSLQEQQRVIDILDQETAQIDTLIAKAEEMIALLREHRVALIAAAVTGQIDVRGWVGA